jgi:hypothetical protein
MDDMKQLTKQQRVAVIRCLVEGNSIRSTVRITGVSMNTIQKLTRDLGEAVLEFQDKVLRNLTCKRVQCDEIWNFCYAKDKNLPDEMRGMPGVGSMWTWTALCADTKLILSWRVGARDAANAHAFAQDIAERMATRTQLTTDGNRLYIAAVDNAFAGDVDFAQLVKMFGQNDSPERASAPPSALVPARNRLKATPTWTTFRPATPSAKT